MGFSVRQILDTPEFALTGAETFRAKVDGPVTVCANHNQASVENIKVIAQAFQIPHQVIFHVLGQYPGIKKLGNGQLLIDSYFKSVSNPMNRDYDDNGRVCPLLCLKSQSEAQERAKIEE